MTSLSLIVSCHGLTEFIRIERNTNTVFTIVCVFGFGSVQEFMTFTSALIVERSAHGSRASVKEQGKLLTHWAIAFGGVLIFLFNNCI